MEFSFHGFFLLKKEWIDAGKKIPDQVAGMEIGVRTFR
jgi:hypothetical protein